MMLRLVFLFLVVSTLGGEIFAHPDDEFCTVDSGLDPALCRQLAEADSARAPLNSSILDEEGNARPPLSTAVLYFTIGTRHILPGGTDHILFVLALFLATERLRGLVIQISAFTVAHTATLGLAAAGLVNPPASIVEPLIAASIAFVAIENLFFRDMSRGRPLIVFGFGLFHGLGFAGFISEVGLPSDQFWSALIGFNIGVELGQLAVVALALLLSLPIKRALAGAGRTYRGVIVQPVSIVIAAIGLWWAVSRTFGL